MQSFYIKIIPLLVILLVIHSKANFEKTGRARNVAADKLIPLNCGQPEGNSVADEQGKFVGVLPGWGDHGFRISTNNDSAQLYFNQGLNFYYSYHFREALASFKEVARFDPGCAMAQWGQALAMGPYYNAYFYKMRKEVPAVLQTMASLTGGSAKERDLVKAMQHRYSGDTTNKDRNALDSAYAAAMSLLTKTYPADNDVKALYVDAVMLKHKWDFWNNRGEARPWTPELVQLCERILRKDPKHPAALHYYIHITEASRHPETALGAADVLRVRMPGVGHMVHMATHMYQRNGLFAKGVYVNEDANTMNNLVDSLAPNLGIGKNTGLHIYAVQSYCAMNAGMYEKGMPVYLRARNRLLDLRTAIEKDAYSQYIYMMPVIAWVRLGMWDRVLAEPAPDAGWTYAMLLDNFAKGMAFARRNDLASAKACLSNLEKLLPDSLLAVRELPFNKPVQCARIAAGILQGTILQEEGNRTRAVAAFTAAVAEEDALIYREPQEWLIPARQYLGNCHLKMKRPIAAAAVYREDLVANPGNGWSLVGMYKALGQQKKSGQAAKYKAAALKAFAAADSIPSGSVF